MIKRFAFILFALLGMPLTATAGLVKIEYTGFISSHLYGGLNYKNGERVNGSMTIDLSKSTFNQSFKPNSISHSAPASDGLVVGDYPAGAITGGSDWVNIYINSTALGDRLQILDVTHYSGSEWSYSYYETQLAIQLPGIDWIHDLSLSGINLNITDRALLGSSLGVYNYGVGTSYPWSNPTISNKASFFSLDSLKITSAPLTTVPESGAVTLLLIGFLGLVLRRKFF